MDWLKFGQAALPIIGGLMDKDTGDKRSSEADELSKQSVEAWKSLALPKFGDLNYERFASAGTLTPEMEAAEQLAMMDQLQNVNLDPRLRTAQMSALETLQKVGQTGMTPEMRAELSSIQRKTEAENQARLSALLQQQDARGVGSSDMGLAMRALDAQSAANRQAEAAQNAAARGFQQALQATASSGSLAGNMEQADYGRQAALADALRNRELMNMQQRAGVQQRNVGTKNAAQQFNLQQAQDIANQNVGLSGKEREYVAYKRPEAEFGAAARRAEGLSGRTATEARRPTSDFSHSKFGEGLSTSIGSMVGLLGNKDEEDAKNTGGGKIMPGIK